MQKNAVNVSDQMLYDILGTELEDSDIIDRKIKEAYATIRARSGEKDAEAESRAVNNGKITDYEISRSNMLRRKNKNTVWRKVLITLGSMAAVLCVTFTFCVMNPVLAREIPILGSIFARVADVYQFGKPPEENTTELISEEGLVAADGGITISVTEEYTSNQAVYIGVKVENVQAFPEMVATIEDGQQFIKARTVEDYSFCPGQRRNRRYIEGKFVDEHTFLGIIRIDYNDIRNYMEESDMAENADIPESFTMKLEIMEIASTLKDVEVPEEFQISDEEYEQMTEEEQTAYLDSIPKAWYGIEYESWHQEGTWQFTVPITQTDESIQTIEVGQFDDSGIGVESIEISSMEMSVNIVVPENLSLYTAVFDADGREIEYHNSSNAGHALLIDGHDISTVSVCLCNLSEYVELEEEYGEALPMGEVEKIAQFKAVVSTGK